MWRHSVRSEDLRLFFAAHRAGLRVDTFRAALGSDAAEHEGSALLSNCDPATAKRVREMASCGDVRYDEASAQQIIPGLWIGPLMPAESKVWLDSRGITHVLDATGGWRRRVSALENAWVRVAPPVQEGREWLQVAMEDRSDFDPTPHIAGAVEFIRRALSTAHGAVLVHCHAGVSRSATLVAAFLIEEYNMTLRCALRVMRDARPSVRPNPGFEQKLVRFEMRRARRVALAPAVGVPPATPTDEATMAQDGASLLSPSSTAKRGRAEADVSSLDGAADAECGSRARMTTDEAACDGTCETSREPACKPVCEPRCEAAVDVSNLVRRSAMTPASEALAMLGGAFGSVKTFAPLSAALTSLIVSGRLTGQPPSTLEAAHEALRRAMGNGGSRNADVRIMRTCASC